MMLIVIRRIVLLWILAGNIGASFSGFGLLFGWCSLFHVNSFSLGDAVMSVFITFLRLATIALMTPE